LRKNTWITVGLSSCSQKENRGGYECAGEGGAVKVGGKKNNEYNTSEKRQDGQWEGSNVRQGDNPERVNGRDTLART